MPGNGSIQSRFLLAMCRIGHGHAFLAPLRLHGRNVENKIGIFDSDTRFRGSLDHTVLAECVADSTDLEVGLGDLNLAAHGAQLAGVLAVGMGVAGFEENLVLLAFPAKIDLNLKTKT